MSDATFSSPDLTMFCRLDDLGLVVVGQRLEPDRAVLACRVVELDQWCRRSGCRGAARDTVVRRLTRKPLGWRPVTLEILRVRRYRCTGCGRVRRQTLAPAAKPRAKLSRPRAGLDAGGPGDPAPDCRPHRRGVLAEDRRALIDDMGRFDGVRVVGVDEHALPTAELLTVLVAIDKKMKPRPPNSRPWCSRASTLIDLPGVGPGVAARILADVGEVARFADRNRFASWTGTAPTRRTPRRAFSKRCAAARRARTRPRRQACRTLARLLGASCRTGATQMTSHRSDVAGEFVVWATYRPS